MEAYLKSFNILTDNDIQSFIHLLSLKKMQKGEYFIREGKISKEVAFINKGILRSYYYNSKGEEVTYCFTFENSFLAAYSSFLTQAETVENIQALTDIEMYTINRDQILMLKESSTNWLKFFKVMTELEYIKMEKRIFLLQKESAEKRYEDLLKNKSEFLQLIPLNYLASYLGITQRHLSRIRSAISN